MNSDAITIWLGDVMLVILMMIYFWMIIVELDKIKRLIKGQQNEHHK